MMDRPEARLHEENAESFDACAHEITCSPCEEPGSRQPSRFTLLEQRITALELSIIEHPTHVLALEALEECLDRARMRRAGRRLKAKARLLYGLSGAGKTTVIEDFERRHPDVPTIDGDIRKVIVVEMPEATTKRALVSAILSEMGYKAGNHENANAIIDDLIDKVQRLGVEMIIIDEGHHVISGKAVLAISEFLKSLLNRIGCQIVIAGLPDLEVMHDFPQLERRLMPDIVLEPYDWTTIEGRLEFLVLMKKFERLLCLPEESNLGCEDFAMRMYVATGGRIGIVTKYLSRALELSTKRGLRRVDLNLMAEIYASWHPAPRTPKHIKFGAKLAIPKGATVETLAAALRDVPIDPESNPFVCAPDHCETLWSKRSAEGDKAVSPARRTRGKGRGPIKPFAK